MFLEFYLFILPVSDMRMSISYRNITCQRHPPVIKPFFFLFSNTESFFCRFLLENFDLQSKCQLFSYYLHFLSSEVLIGFLEPFQSSFMWFAGPAGNTKTHILISAMTINPGFPYLYPKISMFIFGISNLFQFFARGKNHSLVRFGHLQRVNISICMPGGVRSFCTSRFLSIAAKSFLWQCSLGLFNLGLVAYFFTRGIRWDSSVIGNLHSFNLKRLSSRAPETVKHYEMRVYRDTQQANLSVLTRDHHGYKVTNKKAF